MHLTRARATRLYNIAKKVMANNSLKGACGGDHTNQKSVSIKDAIQQFLGKFKR